jgi:DNA-binding CsgD family transcriptional regulator
MSHKDIDGVTLDHRTTFRKSSQRRPELPSNVIHSRSFTREGAMMKLVERAAEVTTLEDLLARCLPGRSAVAMISGAVASGKTALLDGFTERAADTTAYILRATASHTQCNFPLGIVRQLFASMELPAQSAERAAGLLHDGALVMMLHDSTTSDQVRARVVHELCAELIRLTRSGPLMICVDDVHYADGPSMQLLLSLIRQPKPAPIMMVLSACSRLRLVHPALHAELLRQPLYQQIRLGPLSRRGVASMLADRLQACPTDQLAATCYEVSSGNPLLVDALIQDYKSGGLHPPASPIVGGVFGQALVSCLYRCESTILSAARALAILDGSASAPLLGKMLELDAETADRAVRLLNDAGLVSGWQFRHPNARAAVLNDMRTPDRAQMHARAAHLLHRDGAAAVVVAQHLVSADRSNDVWAASVLQEAARQALADGDLDRVLEFLRSANKMITDARQRATITSMAVRAKWRVDPEAAIRHVTELMKAVREGNLKRRPALALASCLLWHGRVDEAAEILGKLDRSTNCRNAETATDVLALRHWASFLYPEVFEQERNDQAGPQSPPAAPSPRLQAAKFLIMVLDDQASDETVLDRAEEILQTPNLDDTTFIPKAAALMALTHSNRVDRAASLCDPLLAEARSLGAHTWRASFSGARAMIGIRQGDLRAAETHARAALAHISPQSWGVAIGMPIACLLLATTATGAYDDAVMCLSMPIPEATFQTPFGLYYLHARGHYYLAIEQFDAALGDFQTCGQLMTRWQIDLPKMIPWRSDAAQAFLGLGRHKEARALVDEQLAMLGQRPSRPRGVSLRVLAATSDPQVRPPLLQDAANVLQESGDRLELAYAYADLGRAHQALGESRQADLVIRRAHHLARQCGVNALRGTPLRDDDRAPDARNALRPRANGLSELSTAERRVAALAAQGHTNREIAATLFVTVSTVEQHLTRVYRKLKVSRRTDLPAELQPSIVDSA